MRLVIVESPSKAKTIEKYLGEDFRVVASVGHIRDLPKSNKKAIDVPAGFVPHYEIVKGKEHIISDIKKLSKKADEVLLATDPDREGEAIAWHISEAVGLKEAKRVVFYEITKEAVVEAIKSPREIDTNLKEAQEARRVLDRLVGYDLSGLIWKKVRYGLSAGRVQSPALRILVEREREIRAFIPEAFWKIFANFKKGKETLTFECSEEPRDKKLVEKILSLGEKSTWSVTQIKESEVKRSPRPPFTTSTLQQAASSRLGFAPSRTMMVAQRLYEAGHITYMRTDSLNISTQARKDIEANVRSKFGDNYFESHFFANKSKNAQEAHEAIRPTHMKVLNAGSTDEQKKLYKLIWSRTMATQMRDASIMRTKVSANIEDSSIPDFSLNGSRILFDGWTKADPAAQGEDVILPEFKLGEKLDLQKIFSEEKATEPPPRYSEAGLVKELEKRGIGRPSTYASIIKTIVERGYVEKLQKALIPTDTGEVVSGFLESNFEKYVSDNFTAEMENELDEIALGKRTYLKTLKDFYTPFHKEVEEKDKLAKATNLGEAPEHFKCPVCGGAMMVKLGRGGRFLSCIRFPDCTGALTINGEEIKSDTPIGTDPESGLPVYLKTGRFGPYVQVGEDDKKKKIKARKASVPKNKDLSSITLENALVYLSLPRELGIHPETGEKIVANTGRFGPYIAHNTKPKPDFRSLKTDDVYAITLERALEILKEPKKTRGFKKKVK